MTLPAKQFAAQHHLALALELNVWADTGLLPDGKLRELAAMVRNENPHDELQIAEHLAHRAIRDAAILAKPEKRAPVQGWAEGIPWSLHLEAYAAYCKRYGAQPALIDLEGRHCRGGFHVGELDEFIPGWREKLSDLAGWRREIAEIRDHIQVTAQSAGILPLNIPLLNLLVLRTALTRMGEAAQYRVAVDTALVNASGGTACIRPHESAAENLERLTKLLVQQAQDPAVAARPPGETALRDAVAALIAEIDDYFVGAGPMKVMAAANEARNALQS